MTAREPTAVALPAISPLTVAVGMGLFALVVRLLLLSGLSGTDDNIYALRGVEIAQGIWRTATHRRVALRHQPADNFNQTYNQSACCSCTLDSYSLPCACEDEKCP